MEIKVVKKVLDANDAIASENRARFSEHGIYVLNVMSAPGSGKTAILERAINKLKADIPTGVIVGDISTTKDAERLAKTGVPVVQINTDVFGGDCHLGAHVIRGAIEDLDLTKLKLLFIENVGNLVCPAEFDVGEDAKAVVLSVTEGEDKPLKYPLMFRVSEVAVLNKVDLLPHLDIDKKQILQNIHAIHPAMPVFETSARTGAGIEAFVKWIREKVASR